MNLQKYLVQPNSTMRWKDYDPDDTGKYQSKEEVAEKLRRDTERLAKYQDILYAQNTYGVLLVVQALDAAGKDSLIKHVFSGVNPQGCQVVSFKQPSQEELDHDYLWRISQKLPNRGNLGIFNRSYYEEVLITRVHKSILDRQQLPDEARTKNIWKCRFEEINAFEQYLVRNGIIILKVYLNASKEEQRKRFLERIDNPDKNWKFSLSDAEERHHWDDYMKAYQDMFSHTSTEWAPWYIVPANNKWYTHVVVSDLLVQTLKNLKLRYPVVNKEHRERLQKAKALLLQE
jgi:PPK2 family polyphosphate:nucleotide phosphotransferase